MTPLQLLTAAFEENRVHVSRDPHERPFRIQPKLCGSTQVWRVVMGGTGTGLGLTVTCALEEIENDQIPYWMARVYVARRDGAVIPSPCVPTTTHWQVYGPDKCSYLWTLKGLDYYAEKESVSALRPYDPRWVKQEKTA